MTRFWFEHWQSGRVVEIIMMQTESITEAVCLLSDQLRGVFRLVDKQTEIQRNKENLKRLESVSGDF